jgi:hypothetical protein
VCVFVCVCVCMHEGSVMHFLGLASNMLLCNEFLDVRMPTHMHARICLCVLCVCVESYANTI